MDLIFLLIFTHIVAILIGHVWGICSLTRALVKQLDKHEEQWSDLVRDYRKLYYDLLHKGRQ